MRMHIHGFKKKKKKTYLHLVSHYH